MSLEEKLKVDAETLKLLLKELKEWKAQATTLLSLYVPPGRPLGDVLSLLRQELSITDNIKLKRTKEAVQTALSMAIERLTMLQKVPENGLVLFCGVNSETRKSECYMFSPPEPVSIYFYRTDKHFHTEFLEEMLEEKDVYGLVIVERDEATIGLLKGARIEVLEELSGYVPGKHSKGGQSQRRFDRIIEQMVHEFYKSVGERVRQLLEPLLDQGKLKGIIVGGPGYSKKDFVEGDYLGPRLKQLVLPQLVDVSYQGEAGLRELVIRASELVKGQKYVEVVKRAEELKLHMAKDDGLAVFGEAEVEAAARYGALATLLVVEDHPRLEELRSLAEGCGAEVVVVPQKMPEGVWLSKAFGGVAGILRYKLQLS